MKIYLTIRRKSVFCVFGACVLAYVKPNRHGFCVMTRIALTILLIISKTVRCKHPGTHTR